MRNKSLQTSCAIINYCSAITILIKAYFGLKRDLKLIFDQLTAAFPFIAPAVWFTIITLLSSKQWRLCKQVLSFRGHLWAMLVQPDRNQARPTSEVLQKSQGLFRHRPTFRTEHKCLTGWNSRRAKGSETSPGWGAPRLCDFWRTWVESDF